MNISPSLEVANKLENILRSYLDCHYNDFGVKANNNLLNIDWKRPINFALGVYYERNKDFKYKNDLKQNIHSFIEKISDYNSVEDVVNAVIEEELYLKKITKEELEEKELQEIVKKGAKKAEEIIDEFDALLNSK